MNEGVDKVDLILTRLKELRDDTKENGERLARLGTQREAVVGNGRAGRLDKVEGSIESLSAWRWRVVGICSGVSGVCTLLGYLVFHR